MTNLIDKQAAIDALVEYFTRIGKLKKRGLNDGEKAISVDTVGAIKSLPSAQQWIPCSKRMPKMGEDVLIWLKKKDPCGKNLRIAYIGYHDVEDKFFEYLGKKLVWYSHVYYYDIEDVIAWMPQPEPYIE